MTLAHRGLKHSKNCNWRLKDKVMTSSWVCLGPKQLRVAKRYLKGDFKVICFAIATAKLCMDVCQVWKLYELLKALNHVQDIVNELQQPIENCHCFDLISLLCLDDEKMELMFVTLQAKQSIEAWKAHLL